MGSVLLLTGNNYFTGKFGRIFDRWLIFRVDKEFRLLDLLFISSALFHTSIIVQKNRAKQLQASLSLFISPLKIVKIIFNSCETGNYELEQKSNKSNLKHSRDSCIPTKSIKRFNNIISEELAKLIALKYTDQTAGPNDETKQRKSSVLKSAGASAAAEQVGLDGGTSSAWCATRDALSSAPARRKRSFVLVRFRCSHFNKRQPVSNTVVINIRFSSYFFHTCKMNTPGPEELSPATDDDDISFMGFPVNDIQELASEQPTLSLADACLPQDVSTFNAGNLESSQLTNDEFITTRGDEFRICEEEDQTAVVSSSSGKRAPVTLVGASSYPTHIFHSYSRASRTSRGQVSAPPSSQPQVSPARPSSACAPITTSTEIFDGHFACRRFSDFSEPSTSRLNSKSFPSPIFLHEKSH